MNIPKKQKRIPSWLPTTVTLLAIVAVILFIYIIVTIINDADKTGIVTPSVAPTITDTPVPTEDPAQVYSQLPLVSVDSQSATFTKVSDYLTSTFGDSFSPDSLLVSQKQTPDSGTLVYAKYQKDGLYQVSELLLASAVTDATQDQNLSRFLLLSRNTEDVASLYIQALISNFYTLRNAENKAQLALLLTSQSETDAEAIISHMEYIDHIDMTSLSLHPLESSMVAYDVLINESISLIGIATPAPGLSEILIQMDSDSYPLIFVGRTDEATDSARDSLKSSSSVKALIERVNEALNAALESDADLKEAYNNLISQ